MRDLRFRRATRTSVLGTTALIAALSLTACQSGGTESAGDAGDSAASGTSAVPVADTGKAAEKPNSGDSGSSSVTGSGSSSGKPPAKPVAEQRQGGGSNAGGSATLPTCTGANTKLTMTAVQRPINHMLLTATNTGSKSCYAYAYPFLRFGEAQAVPQVTEDSRPQSVVVIAPGESAYTGVMTSSADGSGIGGYSTKDLGVHFQDAEGGSTGTSVRVPLSKKVYVDSTLTVTYWQTERDDALMY
ncbi:DUF4232 domain-containing protein [Streptomyces sp. NPDC049944]|uniref:DUF4232 domain-containing protein n=1 Tax=Streptomyces sp. NPDC049944 TaxID=3155657 RepID=UPI003427650B